jgi:RecB family exonuclease
MAGKIEAWSFSRLQDYRSCPLKAKFKHVDKIKEPSNQAMERGSAIGKAAEDFIMGRTKKCIPELKAFEAEFKELNKRRAVCEDQWAFDVKWNEVDWFAKDAWCRVKTDIYSLNLDTNTLLVVDNKTGKIRESHLEQLALYALGAFLKFPTVDKVDVRLWYLDSGHEVPEEPKIYDKAEVPKLKTYWLKQVKPMLADARFAPKPSSECRWCFYGQSGIAKGGPGTCEF